MRWCVIAVAGLVFALGATQAVAADEGPCPPDRAAWMASTLDDPVEAGAPSRLHVRGQKVAARPLNRSEAGVSWSLSPKIALELNYARNAFPPMFANDHDDGLITRLKLGF
jgi:hypothetical protein